MKKDYFVSEFGDKFILSKNPNCLILNYEDFDDLKKRYSYKFINNNDI